MKAGSSYPGSRRPDAVKTSMAQKLARRPATPASRPDGQSQSQSYRERTYAGYACVERSQAEGIKQQAGRREDDRMVKLT
eukprot:366416-Chlamydomonas_euryale.AAC.8